LKRLDLSGNQITEVNFVLDMPLLQELNLSKNSIRAVGDGSFSRLKGLKTLNLNQNRIVEFTEFPDTDTLETCILSFNVLQK
jgi:Leucine-rich repeat (LRR) protein